MCFDYGRCDENSLTKKALVAFCPRGKSEFDRVAPKGDPTKRRPTRRPHGANHKPLINS